MRIGDVCGWRGRCVGPVRVLVAAGSIVGLALSAGASGIVTSNPYYRVYNGSTESRTGEEFATFAFQESRTNTTGDLFLTTSSDYASATGYSDGFVMDASSSVDGADLASGGLDSVTAEGNARFEIDLRLADEFTSPATLVIDYSFDLGLVSSDPRPGFGDPGTDAGSYLRNIRLSGPGGIVEAASLQPGAHLFEAPLDPDELYRLEVVFNAVTSVRESSGFASADASLVFSMSAVPEPSAGLLVGFGLVGLAILRLRPAR